MGEANDDDNGSWPPCWAALPCPAPAAAVFLTATGVSPELPREAAVLTVRRRWLVECGGVRGVGVKTCWAWVPWGLGAQPPVSCFSRGGLEACEAGPGHHSMRQACGAGSGPATAGCSRRRAARGRFGGERAVLFDEPSALSLPKLSAGVLPLLNIAANVQNTRRKERSTRARLGQNAVTASATPTATTTSAYFPGTSTPATPTATTATTTTSSTGTPALTSSTTSPPL